MDRSFCAQSAQQATSQLQRSFLGSCICLNTAPGVTLKQCINTWILDVTLWELKVTQSSIDPAESKNQGWRMFKWFFTGSRQSHPQKFKAEVMESTERNAQTRHAQEHKRFQTSHPLLILSSLNFTMTQVKKWHQLWRRSASTKSPALHEEPAKCSDTEHPGHQRIPVVHCLQVLRCSKHNLAPTCSANPRSDGIPFYVPHHVASCIHVNST